MLKSNSVLFGHLQGLLGFVAGVGLEHVFFCKQITFTVTVDVQLFTTSVLG